MTIQKIYTIFRNFITRGGGGDQPHRAPSFALLQQLRTYSGHEASLAVLAAGKAINYVFLCPRLCVRCWSCFVLWTARSNHIYRWPFGLKRKTAVARFLIMRVRIPPGAWSVVCCQVEFCATGRSPVQRSPTECGVCWVWSGATVILCT